MTDESAETRWREEMTSAWLYRAVAEAEPDARKRAMFRDLGGAAETQAGLLAPEIEGGAPPFAPPLRARIIASLTRLFGPRRLRHALRTMKVRGLSVYTGLPLERGHPMPTTVDQVGARHGGAGGGTLRAAVFGVNDGLVSNTCLIMGVAGATADAPVILLTGIAGLLAGAFSMAAGEYVSMRSQREMFEHQIEQERDELERYPDEEAEELALIYNARGVPLEDAREIAARMVADPTRALDALAREELGLNPDDLGSPWGAAASSFAAFAAGALLPLLPFALRWEPQPVVGAAALSALALFAVGAALSVFSGRSAVHGGVRMLLIGAAAATATYAIGAALGVAVS